jgi:hypothetical protein
VALLVAFTLIGLGANAFEPLGLASRVIGSKPPVVFVMAMILASHPFACYLMPDGKFPQTWMKYAGWFWFVWLMTSVFWKSFPVKTDGTLGESKVFFDTTSWTVPSLVGATLYARDRVKIVALDLGGS